jgi:lipid-A-disaccharide synthase
MRLFFSVGEPSGDLHGANLIRQLAARTNVEVAGLGGPRMRAAGCNLLRDMSDLAVMGLFPVLAKLPEFWRLRGEVAARLDQERPDGVVLIDYPGFNWHVARLAHERGIPVFYYGLPQLWAWASWRVKKVQRYVDHALCKLPFEETWFRDSGCNATYVGHPYFDELKSQRLDSLFISSLRAGGGRLVTVLPGSRTQEVEKNLPLMLKAAAIVRGQHPDARFVIASYNERQAAQARALVAAAQAPAEVFVGHTPELIAAADCCLACSGSVSLELLFHAKPAVIAYRLGWLTYQVVRRLINVRYITLVNLLASEAPLAGREAAFPKGTAEPPGEEPIYPEYPTWRDCSADIARHAIQWLSDERQRQRVISRLIALRDGVAAGGASAKAADYIAATLGVESAGSKMRKAS